MSFWDEFNEKDIHSLISNTESPDFDTILGHSELFQLFRENDQDLVNFFNNPQVFHKILCIMTKNKDTKITKRIVELFLFKDSILLKKLLLSNDLKIAEKLIQCMDNSNDKNNDNDISLLAEDKLVRIGYISRIYMHAMTLPEYKEKIISLFSSSPQILTTLTKHVDISSIFDLLQAYLNLLKPEDQWILFSYLQILLPKGKSASCPKCFIQYKNLIIVIIKEMATVSPLSNQIKVGLLRLISGSFQNSIEVEKNSNSDVISSVSTNLSFIFNSPESNDEIKVLIFELAMIIPPERSILNIAATFIKNSNQSQFNSVSIAALDFLSSSPNKSLSVLLPTIIKTFVADKTNSFHHLSFLNFIKNSISKVPEMREPIIKEMLPLIISESSGNESWRKNAQRVGFFLEIAKLIDQYVDDLASSGKIDQSSFSSWKTFRSTDLKKWKLKDTEKVDAPEAVAMSSTNPGKKRKSLAEAAAAEEEAALMKAKSATTTTAKVETKTTEADEQQQQLSNETFSSSDFGSFPSADSFTKKNEEEKKDSGFGGFGFGDGFPPADSFPKDEKEDEKDKGFGGFGDVSFPSPDSFPKEEKEEESKGFGGFGEAFPSADSFPKENKEDEKDKGFGGFGDVSFPSPDSFPKENKEDEKDKGFGGFGDVSFPSPDSFPKEEKEEENKGFGGFGNAFPSADSFPKENKEEEKNKGFGFGDGFPPADSFPKEEKDKGFGGFDNPAFPSADSFSKDEKEKTENGFGGFTSVDDSKEESNSQKQSEKEAASKNEKDETKEEEEDDDDSDFEDLSQQSAQPKIELSKPSPMPVFTQSKPVSNEPVDVSFSHFLELIDNPCWTYTGPTPAELFGQKDAFSTAEEAFNFLVGKST